MTRGDIKLELPDNPERFDTVLAKKGFLNNEKFCVCAMNTSCKISNILNGLIYFIVDLESQKYLLK